MNRPQARQYVLAFSSLSFSILAVSFTLTGCAVGPDYEEPELEFVPDAWSEAAAGELVSEAPPLATWWESFEDPVLDSLIVRAQGQNRSVAVAAARMEEARAIRGIARSPLYPDLVLGGAAAWQQASDNSAAGQIQEAIGGENDVGEQFDVGFDSFWELDLWGRIRRGAEAAEGELQASMEDYRDVLVTLFAEVGAAYVDVRTAQQRIAFAESNIEAQTQSLELTRDRFNAGLTSALDVAQAESNLRNSEAQIPLLQIGLVQASNRLAVLVGEPPGRLNEVLGAGDGIPTADPQVTAVLPSELLRRRPDVRAAERRLAAQTARIGQRTAELYPTFSLAGLLQLNSTEASTLFESGSVGWALVPGLRWNIFAGGRIRNQIRVEEARTQQLLSAYEQSVLLALEEAENALVALERNRIRLARLEEAVAATERSVELVRTQYLSGLTNFQNVLDSQRSLFNQQDQLAATRGATVQSLIRLNKAMGGGWDPDAAEAMAQAGTPEAN